MRCPPLGGRRPTGAEAGGREGFLEKLSQNESYGQWEVAWQKTQAPGVFSLLPRGKGGGWSCTGEPWNALNWGVT